MLEQGEQAREEGSLQTEGAIMAGGGDSGRGRGQRQGEGTMAGGVPYLALTYLALTVQQTQLRTRHKLMNNGSQKLQMENYVEMSGNVDNVEVDRISTRDTITSPQAVADILKEDSLSTKVVNGGSLNSLPTYLMQGLVLGEQFHGSGQKY